MLRTIKIDNDISVYHANNLVVTDTIPKPITTQCLVIAIKLRKTL